MLISLMIIEIIAFSILFGIIIYLLIKVHRNQEELHNAYFLLGYYRIRFGEVSREDIEKGVGLPQKYKDLIE